MSSTAVLVLCGIPGSGKSSLAQSLKATAPSGYAVEVISFDEQLTQDWASQEGTAFQPCLWRKSRSRSFQALIDLLQLLKQHEDGTKRLIVVDDNMYYR